MIGTKLAHYEITSHLGSGGMGDVYQATDSKLGRSVAIKLLPEAFTHDADRAARFEREARVLASLNHPNIATIYGVEESGGRKFLVMELVTGETLAGKIKRGAIPLDESLGIATQITEALEAAHEKGVIHRDLKPANIKVTPEGKVKVLDFGLAKAFAGETVNASLSNSPTISIAATQQGMILGTAAYMSPEQAKGKEVDRRTDIFAFGAVLYEMLTGSPAFGGEDVSDILSHILRSDPNWTLLPANVPHRIRELLKLCLQKDAKKRRQAAGDIRIDMEQALAEPVPAAPTAPARRGSRMGWVAFAVALLAAGALAVPALRHFREEPPKVTKFEFPPPENGSLNTSNGPPAVSPDGRRVAFRTSVNGKNMLWVRDLDLLNSRMLPGTENPTRPFWAPDSRQLAFFANGKLMKIDVTGGPATTITNTPVGSGGTWNPDDVIVFSTQVTSQGTGLSRVSAAGGTPTPATELDESRNETAHASPQFLPDEHHFLYLALSSDAEKSGIFVGDLQSKDKKLVLQATSNAFYVEPAGGAGNGYLLFVRENTLMAQPFDTGKLQTAGDAVPVAEHLDTPSRSYSYAYFGASRNGTLAYASGGAGANLQITWYDRSGKAVGTVGKPADIQTPRLSPNGKMVAVDRLDPQTGKRDIWLHDLARGAEQRLTFADDNTFPVWSPDSSRVAYERRGLDRKVMLKPADGAGQEEVLEAADKRPMDWTRDSSFLITEAVSVPKTAVDLWSLPMSGAAAKDRMPVVLRQTEFVEAHARVSSDGRWLAYGSNESKRNEIYVMGFPSLNGHGPVSVNGGTVPTWNPNGRELYFVSPDNKLMAVEIKPGAQFQAGVPQPLFDVRLGTSSAFDVDKDGRFLIATPVEQSATVPMTVVLNWQQALKK